MGGPLVGSRAGRRLDANTKVPTLHHTTRVPTYRQIVVKVGGSRYIWRKFSFPTLRRMQRAQNRFARAGGRGLHDLARTGSAQHRIDPLPAHD